MAERVKLTRREGMQAFAGLLGAAGFATTAPASDRKPERNSAPEHVRLLVDLYEDNDGLYATYLSRDGETSTEQLFAFTSCFDEDEWYSQF